jgi:hypothetical protein
MIGAVTAIHITGGVVALLAGLAAVVSPKGGPVHARAGTFFALSMLILGVTAGVLPRLAGERDSGVGGLVVCYFVLTSWMTARRRDGTTGRFEIAACALVLGAGALMGWGAATVPDLTPVGPGPVYALAAISLFAGLLDLKVILRRRMSPAQRLSRHLWRMCFAFFIATGSFFLGQQQVFPKDLQGSPVLLVLAFAPFAAMAFWLVRVRFSKMLSRLTLRAPAPSLPFMGREARSVATRRVGESQ